MEIEQIHELIEKVCPIYGVYKDKDGIVNIHYKEEATSDQIAASIDLVQQLPLLSAKQNKMAKIDKEFSNKIDSGFLTSYGWKLGLSIDGLVLLSSLYLMATTCEKAGLQIPSIIDTDGMPHLLDMQWLTVIMLQYGEYRSQMSLEYATKKKSVNDATTIEEVENV
jgi:hypothetical protein